MKDLKKVILDFCTELPNLLSKESFEKMFLFFKEGNGCVNFRSSKVYFEYEKCIAEGGDISALCRYDGFDLQVCLFVEVFPYLSKSWDVPSLEKVREYLEIKRSFLDNTHDARNALSNLYEIMEERILTCDLSEDEIDFFESAKSNHKGKEFVAYAEEKRRTERKLAVLIELFDDTLSELGAEKLNDVRNIFYTAYADEKLRTIDSYVFPESQVDKELSRRVEMSGFLQNILQRICSYQECLKD